MNHSLSEHSEHFNVKSHFFWEYVDEGHVKISKCSTEDHCAEKGLVFEKFANNRKSIKAGD